MGIEDLRCPRDRAPLEFRPGLDSGAGRESPTLLCTACRWISPLSNGIPDLPPPDHWEPDAAETVRREQAFRDDDSVRYDGMLGLRLFSHFELPLLLSGLRGADARVAEVGCGTGRVTLRLAALGARVLAVDHSLASLNRLQAKLSAPGRDAVQLVRSDATQIPVADGWATHVVSAQLLEHVPTEALRRRVIAEMARVLRPGGRLALTAYRALPWLRQEGFHSGELYFHRFRREELARLLDPWFDVTELTGRLGYVWLVRGRRR